LGFREPVAGADEAQLGGPERGGFGLALRQVAVEELHEIGGGRVGHAP